LKARSARPRDGFAHLPVEEVLLYGCQAFTVVKREASAQGDCTSCPE